VGRPDWPKIRRLANELIPATASVRRSLIENDFDVGLLIPAKDWCVSIGLAFNEVLELPLGEVDGDMTTTVSQALGITLDLEGPLVTLIDIGTELTGDLTVRARVELKESWFNCRKTAITASLSAASMLHALVEIIDLLPPQSGDDTGAGTAS
jgi:hypothetical protein